MLLLAGTVLFFFFLFSLSSEYLEFYSGESPFGLATLMNVLVGTIFPLLIIALFVGGVVILFVFPPSALISYLVAKPLTRRLLALAQAVRKMRNGELSTRVTLEGEDEVAQLQDDFNNMAIELEKTTNALCLERDKVAALLKAQRELTVAVSHELRTPVSTLRSYLDASLDHWQEQQSADLRKDLDVMNHEVEHLQSLIEDLFVLSRAEINQLNLECKATQVKPLIQNLVEMASPLAWRSGKVQVSAAEISEKLPPAWADYGRLEQVLSNLLQNAIRHTPPGGIVIVSAGSENEKVWIQVCDTGEGIAQEDLPHIWERFYRAGKQTESGHAGLGLALARELVEAMEGNIEVTSQVGQGSFFIVRLKTCS